MKGPFERLKYDLRRIWECPQCGHKVRTDGTVTTQFCRCGKPNTNPAVSMKLVGDGPRRLVPPVPPPQPEPDLPPEAAVTQVDVLVVAPVTVEVTTAEIQLPAAEVQPPTKDAEGPEA